MAPGCHLTARADNRGMGASPTAGALRLAAMHGALLAGIRGSIAKGGSLMRGPFLYSWQPRREGKPDFPNCTHGPTPRPEVQDGPTDQHLASLGVPTMRL